ncbi:MAG TPA: choice-of-anchor V domain-containing protein [Planctomycetota bacterium]
MRSKPRFLLTAGLATGLTLLVTTQAVGILRSDVPATDTAWADYNQHNNCKGCHSGHDSNSGGGNASITGVPRRYMPGSTYVLKVTVAKTGMSRWGFELTATDESGAGTGTFGNPDQNTQIQTAGGREFASQNIGGTFQGTLDGPVCWTVEWTAPPAGAGRVYFWSAMVAADDDGTEAGDFLYNFARASAEGGVPGPDATVLAQVDFPIPGDDRLSRSGDSLAAEIRVSNHRAVSDTYAVATQVRLPNGNIYPGGGAYITVDMLTLAAGQTGTVSFSRLIPASAPIGTYEFQVLMGRAPGTLIDTFSFSFQVVP